MVTSNNGINLIKSFEGGARLKAYKALPDEDYYTIGYGHYGADVKANMTITQAQADAYLKADLAKFEAKVNKYQAQYNFNQNQYDALVSFAYNVGNIDGLTKKGTRTIEQIANSFKLYNKCKKKVVQGLVNRRAKEKALFESKTTNTVATNGNYYPKYTGASTQIDVVFQGAQVENKYRGSYKARKPIADANGIKNYTGSATQNITLINLAKSGLLKRPV